MRHDKPKLAQEPPRPNSKPTRQDAYLRYTEGSSGISPRLVALRKA